MLKTAMKVLGFTNRDVERKLGLSGSYLSRLFSGMIDLKVDHVVAISRVVGMEPEEMFQIAFPRKRKPQTAAAIRLRETLEEYQRTGNAPWGGSLNLSEIDFEEIDKPPVAAPPEDKGASDLEQALEKMMAKALHKVLDKMG
ncbi:MAG TPA: helix-turn-helix transcriptional regulator [Thermoanaerobaculia bacterium]|jgi:transcriptional regulator with XRE-family HTH domain|nr:helix-turn-helix transcriptional regulator [Thermoanaerobaculia bacterium]